MSGLVAVEASFVRIRTFGLGSLPAFTGAPSFVVVAILLASSSCIADITAKDTWAVLLFWAKKSGYLVSICLKDRYRNCKENVILANLKLKGSSISVANYLCHLNREVRRAGGVRCSLWADMWTSSPIEKHPNNATGALQGLAGVLVATLL
ncbi:hypothetical protein L484_021237 [Morus notabilis]|uniref:Uncharacterized protein n=1 Tax=Morus notabilis TaxID=981085 RepID=W9S3P9_9ROSA|nr:hypothetical protein L484_021237 [Morus notabilis]